MTFYRLLFALALVAPQLPAQGGWGVGDVFVYGNGCRTEESIVAAARFFAQESNEPFLNTECFAMRRLIPMRLVRPVGEFQTVSGDVIYVWEIFDMMREKAFTLLPPRAEMVGEEETI